ncbi:MAG: hypothetical protein DHS20C18_27740 [Saprospiraceae bacterium]|nr:MAG: hypothetical protein DHS20C18_27740 [Saprospiraceae bacterium]
MRLSFMLLLLFTFTFSGIGQKRVLIEKFTSVFCGNCPNSALVVKDLLEQYPGTIWVNHHKPTHWMDYYFDNDQSDVLWDASGTAGTPSGMIDRRSNGNGLAFYTGAWSALVAEQVNAPYYANLSVGEVSYNSVSRRYTFTVTAEFDEAPPTGDYRLSVIMLEDSVVGGYGFGFDQSSYYNEVEGHPLQGLGNPIDGYKQLNVARAILDGPWGTAGVIPESPEVGTVYSQEYHYYVPGEYDSRQFKVVALIAHHNADDVNDRQVLNATEARMSDFGLTITDTETPVVDDQWMKIYPNPTSDWLQLEFAKIPASAQLLNSQGQLIRTLQVNELSHTLSVTDLPKGLYFLQLTLDGQLLNRKVLVE